MFFFYSKEIQNDQLILSGDEHQHCVKALRKNEGDTITVTDGRGNLFKVEIHKIEKNNTICKITHAKHSVAYNPKIIIAVAPTKNISRTEWFIEKAVETGVNEILIFNAAHSERKHFNTERAIKIAISAMKQSKQLYLPEIRYFNSYNELLMHCKDIECKFIAHCSDEEPLLMQKIIKGADAVVLIGPEGDFSREEINTAILSGFTGISLGPSRLRTETAALTSLILLRFRNL